MALPRGPLNVHEDPVVQSFLRRQVASPRTFVSRIHKNDEMFLFDLKANDGDQRRTAIGYYTLGARICTAIRQVATWHFGRLENVESFLDFACGYGRSTRFLGQMLPPDRIWACDISPEAVEFQRRNLGVNGIVSVPDPAGFPTAQKFDYVFASSFFTHMPERTFGTWLRTLRGLLTPRGILAFTTHDFSLIPPSTAKPAAGILFSKRSESRTLPGSQYGSTYVSERFVREVVDEVTAGRGRLHRIERGLCHFQDLYLLADTLNREFAELEFSHDPVGYLDRWKEGPGGVIELAGWAADLNAGGSVKEVAFVSGDRLVGTAAPGHDRPDIAEYLQCPSARRSGWTCRIGRHEISPDGVFEASVTNHVGHRTVIVCDYPEAISRRCAAGGAK